MSNQRWLMFPAAVLVAAQVVHAVAAQALHLAAPRPTNGGSAVGTVVGALLLVASIAALVGAGWGRAWARPLLRWTGATVMVGFLLYHGLPFETPLTHPYVGHSVGLVPWLAVLGTIVVGAWSFVAASPGAAVAGPPRSAASVTAMDITVHGTVVPNDDPDPRLQE